jgi:hypothetical protein
MNVVPLDCKKIVLPKLLYVYKSPLSFTKGKVLDARQGEQGVIRV